MQWYQSRDPQLSAYVACTLLAVAPSHEGFAAVGRQSRTRSPVGGACVARFSHTGRNEAAYGGLGFVVDVMDTRSASTGRPFQGSKGWLSETNAPGKSGIVSFGHAQHALLRDRGDQAAILREHPRAAHARDRFGQSGRPARTVAIRRLELADATTARDRGSRTTMPGVDHDAPVAPQCGLQDHLVGPEGDQCPMRQVADVERARTRIHAV